jgi:hypothetical protein
MTRAGRKEISGRDGEKGTHDVFLVVCGSPVLGAPVADPQQQRPPARAHGVRGGEAGGGPVWRERFWVVGCGFLRFGRGLVRREPEDEREIITARARLCVPRLVTRDGNGSGSGWWKKKSDTR